MNESIKQAVMAGLGIAFVSAHTVASEIDQARLTVLDVICMPTMGQWYCITPRTGSISLAALALRDYPTNGTHAIPEYLGHRYSRRLRQR